MERLSDLKDFIIELFFSEPQRLSSYHNSRKYSVKLTGLLSSLVIFNCFDLEPQIKAVKTRLQCRSGLNLAMKLTDEEQPKLQVCGVKSDGPETVFYLIPVGLRQVAIQQVETQCYVGMNASGKLFPAVSSFILSFLGNAFLRRHTRMSANSKKMFTKITGVSIAPCSTRPSIQINR